MKLHIFISLFLFLISCSATEEESNNPFVAYSITSIELSRVDSTPLDNVQIDFKIEQSGVGVSGLTPTVSSTNSSATLTGVTDRGNGLYRASLSATKTGEFPLTISIGDVSETRTPLILKDVHSNWSQPMKVRGYVNTEGYEDGLTVTPNGEYLFVQTGPHYFMGVFAMTASRTNSGCGGATSRLTPTRCEHPWVNDLIGSYTAPERPGFFDGRLSGDKHLHNSNSYNVAVDAAPNFAMATMFYGFKRQSDGSFKEPFYIAFDDQNDAIINPFGMSFMDNGDGTTATMLFSFDDPSDPDMVDLAGDGSVMVQSYFDVYTTQITYGQNNNLGEFVPAGAAGAKPVRGTTFNSTLVNFGKTGLNGIAGTQGNPSIYFDENRVVKSIWTDDEFDSGGDHGELSVYVLTSGTFPNGTWQKVTLPTKINIADPSDETQPYFTGNGLYFTRSGNSNPEIWYSSYSGDHSVSGYGNAANWGTPEKILSMDSTSELGRIVTIGEPTIATYEGETYLYFIYGYNRSYDGDKPARTGLYDIDLQAGYIKLK